MTKAYQPVGNCIYCNKTDDCHDLTDEHIVPYALGGKLVLPKSSCTKCASVTGKFEQQLLRGAYRGIKERLQIQSRTKRKDRPKSLPVFCVDGDERKTAQIPIEHYPASVILPIVRGPLIADFELVPDEDGLWTHLAGLDATRLAEIYRIKSFATMSFDSFAFYRMIAKIAHSGAIAELGQRAFHPYLQPLIIEEKEKNDFRNLIGSFANSAETKDTLPVQHRFQYGTEEASGFRYLICKLQLFSNFGAPIYRIVVGQLVEHYYPSAFNRPSGKADGIYSEDYRVDIKIFRHDGE